TTCKTSCNSDGDCSPGNYCCTATHQCLALNAPNGQCCSSDAQCGSGHCVDGLCCDTACTGQCASCSLAGSPGTCTATATPTNRPTCIGGQCGAACDGVSETCPYPSGNPCGIQACASLVETDPGTCNGTGQCTGSS